MTLPSFPDFQPDHDDDTSIDDLYWQNVDLRIERMSGGVYWLMAKNRETGEERHVDIAVPYRSRTRIRAVPRR